MKVLTVPVLLLLAMAAGCNTHDRVVAVTGTNIGIAVNQNPQTQLYEAKLGYTRAEYALVPTNRAATDAPGDKGNGAKDSADVIMEINQTGIFSPGQGGIYQRLAVGQIAVQQPGAAALFAKRPDGSVDPAMAAVIANTKAIPIEDAKIVSIKATLANAEAKFGYQPGQPNAALDKAAMSVKRSDGTAFASYASFKQAYDSGDITADELQKIYEAVRELH